MLVNVTQHNSVTKSILISDIVSREKVSALLQLRIFFKFCRKLGNMRKNWLKIKLLNGPTLSIEVTSNIDIILILIIISYCSRDYWTPTQPGASNFSFNWCQETQVSS